MAEQGVVRQMQGAASQYDAEDAMEEISDLLEAHVRELELQLRRIDESLLQAHQVSAATPVRVRSMLGQIQVARDRLVHQVDGLKHALRDRGVGTKPPAPQAGSVFGSLGLEFERTLATVFGSPKHP